MEKVHILILRGAKGREIKLVNAEMRDWVMVDPFERMAAAPKNMFPSIDVPEKLHYDPDWGAITDLILKAGYKVGDTINSRLYQ